MNSSSKARSQKAAGRKNGKHATKDLSGAGQRSDEGRAFLPDPYDKHRAPARAGDSLAENLAEEFVASATTAEEVTEDQRDEVQLEEFGGPFTETTGAEEFANDTDDSNPPDAEREPFPTATRLPN